MLLSGDSYKSFCRIWRHFGLSVFCSIVVHLILMVFSWVEIVYIACKNVKIVYHL